MEESSEIYERLAELAIEIGRVTGAASNFAIFRMEKSEDYYLLGAVLKMYLTGRGLRRLFLPSVLQIWLHLHIYIYM